MQTINKYILEGKIKIQINFWEMLKAINEEAPINADEAITKYLKSLGVNVVECDLRVGASGNNECNWYEKERKGKWHSWCKENVED